MRLRPPLARACSTDARSGQTLTSAGRLVAEAAERIELEGQALMSALAAQQRRLAGSVRLTTSELLGHSPGHTLPSRLLCAVSRGAGRVDDDRQATGHCARRGGCGVARKLASGRRGHRGPAHAGQRLGDLLQPRLRRRAWGAQDRDAIRGHDIVGMEGQMAQLAAGFGLPPPRRTPSFASAATAS